ncbi:hypothetical protein GALL_483390 [mine drainage metagenome]|uniref:Uncharacterized protein n=1 Tax=mine drainage metagenome TaxID=410659 RepID=A0A1J5Q2G0_9ZZZZ
MTQHFVDHLDFKSELVGNRFQAVSLFINGIGKQVCHFGILSLGLLGFEVIFNTGPKFFKTALLGCLDIGQLDDVVAKVRLHDITDFSFFHCKGGIFKRFDHGSPGKKVQIAALAGRARILGILFGNIGKTVRCQTHLFEKFLCFLLGLETLGRRCVLGCADQDVAGPAFFFATEPVHVLVVVRLQVSLRDLDSFLDGFKIEDHVFDFGLFGCHEQRLIGFVKGLKLGIGGVDF